MQLSPKSANHNSKRHHFLFFFFFFREIKVSALLLFYADLLFILWGDLHLVLLCDLSFGSSVLLAKWLPCLGYRMLVCVLFVCIFVLCVDLCLFPLLLGVRDRLQLWLGHSLDFSFYLFFITCGSYAQQKIHMKCHLIFSENQYGSCSV